MSPTVTLLAHTVITRAALDLLEPYEPDGVETRGADHLAEVAGRACYESWHRPNPRTAANTDYLANVLGQGHESVVSHAAATFYLTGVSRTLTHELVRHRWLSFSQLSQRYVEPDDLRPVYPPTADESDRANIDATFRAGVDMYRKAIERYERRGITGKQAREAARAHLPNATETRVVVSGNLRAWRDFLRQRLSPHAEAEIRGVAELLLLELVALAPATFADAAEWSA